MGGVCTSTHLPIWKGGIVHKNQWGLHTFLGRGSLLLRTGHVAEEVSKCGGHFHVSWKSWRQATSGPTSPCAWARWAYRPREHFSSWCNASRSCIAGDWSCISFRGSKSLGKSRLWVCSFWVGLLKRGFPFSSGRVPFSNFYWRCSSASFGLLVAARPKEDYLIILWLTTDTVFQL